jgi:hypothetical protein
MTIEEFNVVLLKEMIISKEKNEVTDELKELFIKLIKQEIGNIKYDFLNNRDKDIFEVNAYWACYKNAIKINLEKSVNVYSYVRTIIRSSFAGTIVKIKKLRNESQNT